VCKYGLLYLVASAIAVLRVQLHFVDCFNKRKKSAIIHRKLATRDVSRPLQSTLNAKRDGVELGKDQHMVRENVR